MMHFDLSRGQSTWSGVFGWGWRLLDSWPIRWQERCPGMVFWAKSLWSLYGPIVCKSYKTCDLVGGRGRERGRERWRGVVYPPWWVHVVYWLVIFGNNTELQWENTELISLVFIPILLSQNHTKHSTITRGSLFPHTWWEIASITLGGEIKLFKMM